MCKKTSDLVENGFPKAEHGEEQGGEKHGGNRGSNNRIKLANGFTSLLFRFHSVTAPIAHM